MPQPRALVVRTAGTNCDLEAVHACRLAGAAVDLLHIRRLIEDPAPLERAHLLVLPGGFSYGDDLGAGRILANEIRSLLGDAIRAFIDSGKLVLGICNGFQVLVKAGLLAGDSGVPSVTLVTNDSDRFEDRWVHLRVESDRCPFVERGERLYLPVAHAEGKLLARDESVLDELARDDQVVLRYVDAAGSAAGYPDNPNGSMRCIAGICSPCGRILGLMPHPERHVSSLQHPSWTRRPPGEKVGEGDGLRIFRRAMEVARAELV